MGEAFQETLDRIKSQSEVLGDRDEKAVEFVVILPLLQQLGWNIHDVTEVYPQRRQAFQQSKARFRPTGGQRKPGGCRG